MKRYSPSGPSGRPCEVSPVTTSAEPVVDFPAGKAPQGSFGKVTDIELVDQMAEVTLLVRNDANLFVMFFNPTCEHCTDMTVELINPIAMDEGLRFAIREGGRTVGAGRVTKIIK